MKNIYEELITGIYCYLIRNKEGTAFVMFLFNDFFAPFFTKKEFLFTKQNKLPVTLAHAMGIPLSYCLI